MSTISSSPLLPYSNCEGVYYSDRNSEVAISNGRLDITSTAGYYLQLFLRRAESSGTDSGVRLIPNQESTKLAGYKGQSFIYRGYVIGYANISNEFTLGTSTTSGLNIQSINSRPQWLTIGGNLDIIFGDSDRVMHTQIITASGKYGSAGIDDTIMNEIRGVPITLIASEYRTS